MSIKVEHLNYIYSQGTAYEKQALKDICLEILQGQFVGVIGHTGSGKSTLIQHFNGLIKATDGKLLYDGKNIYDEDYESYVCDKNMDEDEYIRLMTDRYFQCPFYRNGDEYAVVRKQM